MHYTYDPYSDQYTVWLLGMVQDCVDFAGDPFSAFSMQWRYIPKFALDEPLAGKPLMMWKVEK